MDIDDKIGKGIMFGAGLLTAANLFVGAATLADKIGIVEALALYSDVQYRVYDKLHEDYPLLVWGTWHEEPPDARLERYKFWWRVDCGFIGLIIGSFALYRKEDIP